MYSNPSDHPIYFSFPPLLQYTPTLSLLPCILLCSFPPLHPSLFTISTSLLSQPTSLPFPFSSYHIHIHILLSLSLTCQTILLKPLPHPPHMSPPPAHPHPTHMLLSLPPLHVRPSHWNLSLILPMSLLLLLLPPIQYATLFSPPSPPPPPLPSSSYSPPPFWLPRLLI